MSSAVERAVAALPDLTRTQVVEEDAVAGDRFWAYFSPLALSADPGRAVDDDMKRALLNELEPSEYTEAAGRWPALRAHLRQAMALIAGAEAGARVSVSGLGQADIWSTISSIVSTVGKTATSVYSELLQAKLAKAQAESLQRQQAMVQQAEQQAAAQQAAAQQAQRAAVQAAAAPAGWWPSWATWALAAALGGVGLIFVVRLARRRR